MGLFRYMTITKIFIVVTLAVIRVGSLIKGIIEKL